MSKSLLTRIMREYAGGGHSIFAPSASKRWLNCHQSLIGSLFEPDETSFEAAEGTVAHGIAEEWLRTGIKPKHLIGTTIHYSENGKEFDIYVSKSMIDYLEEYVDWCVFEGGEMYVETRVWFTDLMPYANADELEENPDATPIPFAPQGGTADNIIIRGDTIIITDLKYGTGVQVFAEGNTQALLYAYGSYRMFRETHNIRRVVIRIAQPRLDHMDEWEVTVEELEDFADYVKDQAKSAWSLNAKKRATADGCRFCRQAHNCAALAFAMESAVGADLEFLGTSFGEYEMSIIRDALSEEYRLRRADFGVLSTKDMAKILPFRKVVENWFNRLDEALEKRALKGEEIPGMKLVEARTNRRYLNEENVKEFLEFIGLEEDQVISRKLLTPNQLEAVLKDIGGFSKESAPKLLEDLAYKPEGKPTLVPLTDKRPPIGGRFKDAFDDEDDDEEV